MDIEALSSLLVPVGFMLAGIVLLIKGGNWTVDGSVFIARKFGLSPMIVGFTIVAFGTSLPELVISILANLEGSAGIALGNVLGSNIANVLLVLGFTAIIVPLASRSQAILRDLFVMLLATGLLTFLMLSNDIGRIAGFAMVGFLIGYIVLQYKLAQAGDLPMEEEEVPEFSKPLFAYGFLLLGLVAIAGGAELLVSGAQDSARIIGVPEAVIGLSIIALGTSLPELSTCIVAARKGLSDIVFGNIIGSNVFNVLMILGITSLVKPITAGSFAPQLVNFDIWIVVLSSVIFALLILLFGRIHKIAGYVFCAAYVLYNLYIYGIYMAA